MPKSARQVYDETIYHIMQRGNNRQMIFTKNADCKRFLSLVKKYKAKYPFELYNYCLMKNHFHLLVKIHKKESLAKIMQGILQSFGYYFKEKYQYTGYLYQGRYKSKIIEKDEYLLECARYIETNPLRAGIVKNLDNYKWSSYTFYAYGDEKPLLTPNPLYSTFGRNKTGRKSYRDYVLTPRMYENIIDGSLKI